MAVPKRKTSKSKRNQRRSHHGLTATQWSACSQCGDPVLPHRVCGACGYYRGRMVIETVDDE